MIGLASPDAQQPVPDLFTGIRWSSTSTRADTIEAAGRYGLQVELLDSWHDIDNQNDLAWLRQELPNRNDALRAPATTTVVNELLRDNPQLR